jgi:prolyl oligopeptidase
LYAYGGFNVSMTPSYMSIGGKLWLEEAGGAYVLANIRGGGEFGNAWHEAAKVPHRNRAYEDLIAVAEDLVARQIAMPKGMSIEGGSNGGLLTAAVAMLRPDLFGAVVSSVPLTDMLRFHRLSAGSSWMAEYGNPDADPAARAFWERYSPYHNVRPDWSYPEILFTTSTADDRVHPSHARKMVARLESQGHPALLFENREGGHGGAADSAQSAKLNALKLVYLCQKLLGATSR